MTCWVKFSAGFVLANKNITIFRWGNVYDVSRETNGYKIKGTVIKSGKVSCMMQSLNFHGHLFENGSPKRRSKLLER